MSSCEYHIQASKFDGCIQIDKALEDFDRVINISLTWDAIYNGLKLFCDRQKESVDLGDFREWQVKKFPIRTVF